MKLYYHTIATPVGTLKLVANATGLVAILWPHADQTYLNSEATPTTNSSPILAATAAQLAEYFAGARTGFDLPLDPVGTAFQKLVWQGLRQIPFGVTKSYSDLAESLGHPKASRAVGAANGRNPLPIVVPCHRVIGADGELRGFAGGLESKAWLLRLERALV